MKRSLKERFEEKYIPEPNTGCWLWTGSYYKYGYGSIRIGSRTDGSRTMIGAHIISYKLFKGEIPTGMYVCHKCDIPECVNPDHLFLGTPSDNTLDMVNKKRNFKPSLGKFGENNHLHKLTQIEVNEIREKYATGNYYQRELAKEYGVAQTQISRLILYKRWCK